MLFVNEASSSSQKLEKISAITCKGLLIQLYVLLLQMFKPALMIVFLFLLLCFLDCLELAYFHLQRTWLEWSSENLHVLAHGPVHPLHSPTSSRTRPLRSSLYAQKYGKKSTSSLNWSPTSQRNKDQQLTAADFKLNRAFWVWLVHVSDS